MCDCSRVKWLTAKKRRRARKRDNTNQKRKRRRRKKLKWSRQMSIKLKGKLVKIRTGHMLHESRFVRQRISCSSSKANMPHLGRNSSSSWIYEQRKSWFWPWRLVYQSNKVGKLVINWAVLGCRIRCCWSREFSIRCNRRTGTCSNSWWKTNYWRKEGTNPDYSTWACTRTDATVYSQSSISTSLWSELPIQSIGYFKTKSDIQTDGQNKPEELKKDKEITDKPEGGCKYKNFFVSYFMHIECRNLLLFQVSHKRELFLLAGVALVVAFYVRKHWFIVRVRGFLLLDKFVRLL